MRDHISYLIIALLLAAFASCEKESGPAATQSFDYLFFVRQGGGDKVFTVRQAPYTDAVSIFITRIQFRDTLFQFLSNRNQVNDVAFASLDDALHRRIPIEGDLRQPTEPTGTWARLYMVWAGQRFEITNTDLRARLLGFEALVEDRLPQSH